MLTNDIQLNGVSFNVVPGGYKKGRRKPLAVSKPPARKVIRTELGPFHGGLGQATIAGSLRPGPHVAGWDGITVGPAFAGQGVEPFPHWEQFNDGFPGFIDLVSATTRAYGVVAGTAAFIGIGRHMYKSVALTNGTWAALTAVADLGAGFTISGLAYYQDDLLVMLSTGQDIRKFNTATNSLSVWRTGEKGQVGAGYAGQLVYAPRAANAQEELRLSGTKWNGNAVTHVRYLDAPILNMALFNGKVAIATRKSLYFMGGQPYPGEADDATVTADTSKAPEWRGDPEPVMTHGTFAEGDDFVFLESYRGKLYTWLGGQVAEFDDSTEEARWQRIGPEGVRCFGACVAGDWLIVAIVSRYEASSEVWGFNGEGWWLLFRKGLDPWPLNWPCPLAGAGNRDVVVFENASTFYDLFRLRWRSTTLNTYATAGTWTSPLIDGGSPNEDKRWLRGGAVFASPGNRGNSASVDRVIFPLEYSIDGGVTWTQAVSQNATEGATRVFTRDFSLTAAPPASRVLQLRQRWSSVSDWAPVLTSLWVECETATEYALAELAAAEYAQGLLDEARQRRRWEITLGAGDREVRRDGQVDALTGRQKIESLWAAWEAGAPVSFLDVDSDTDPGTYTVEIVDIEERAPKPADAARWGESVITVTLEEAAVGDYPNPAGVFGIGTVVPDPAGVVTLPTVPVGVAAIEARVDTLDSDPTDDVVSIAATGTIASGTLLVLRSLNSARDPRLVDSAAGASGLLRLVGDFSYTLASATANGILLSGGGTGAAATWTELARW